MNNDNFNNESEGSKPYSARGGQNLNQPTNNMAHTETLDVMVDNPINNEVILLDESATTPEIIENVKIEKPIIEEVVEEYKAPEINKFLTTETPPVVPQQVNYDEPVVNLAPEVKVYDTPQVETSKFSGVFNQQTSESAPVAPSISIPDFQEKPVLTPPRKKEKAVKKGISKETLLLLLLFIGGIIFVMFLPEISGFFNGLGRK